MSLFIASLNSGSNGNCYYLGNERDAVLIDAGISCRETERRMSRLGLSMKKIRAIFISHEHSDHIGGVAVLSKKYDLPVYITPATLQNSGLQLAHHLPLPFAAYQPVIIGEIAISAFPKFHDAAHAHSFIVEHLGVKVGVLTDIGAACEHVIKHFSQCHAAFLEANYDDEMLDNGGYPYHLKRRIRGGQGKWLMKRAMRQHLPDDILKRTKMGFVTPIAAWFRGPLAGEADRIARGAALAATGWFQPAELARIAADHRSGRSDHGRLLWQLLMLDKSLTRLFGA